MKRSGLVAALLLALATPLLGQQAKGSRRPNVVLIVADYGGYGDFEPYGARDVRTPNVARLAREGVRLTNAYATAPICTPSRAALLTGRYQHRIGLESNVNPTRPSVGLPTSEPTLPSLFKGAGYATAMYGKWHLGYEPRFGPNAHGFDEFFGLLDWTIDYYSHRTIGGEPGLYEGTSQVERPGYLTDLLTERAVTFVERSAASPFFLYVAYNAPLPPCQPPGRPADVRSAATWHSSTREDYVAVVEALDAGVGRILGALERRGLRKDTLVIFSYDHGGRGLSRNMPLFHGFGTLWEGGIRVPGILSWPGRLPQGKTFSQLAVSMDLTASMLAAAGIVPPQERSLDGIDLLPILDGSAREVERTFFWRVDTPTRKQKAARRGKWKYVRDGSFDMLFDLDADIGEREDVWYRHRDVGGELKGLLQNWEKGLPAPPQP